MLELLKDNPFLGSCLLASLLAAIWKARSARKIPWTPVLFPPIWAFASTVLLGISALLLPITLDRYLYHADGGFGFQPAFAGARLLLGNPWLWRPSEACYFNLPLAMALLYFLLLQRRGEPEASAFVRLAILLAVAGYCLYFAFPAVGPVWAFHRDFPYRAPDGPVVPTAMPRIARNCMPSLHAAWIYAMLFCAAPLAKWFTRSLWVFSGLTLLYTVSAGGHYLVDLVVAIPFTLAVRYASRSEWRSPGFAANATLVLLWLALLRFANGAVALPVILYPLTIGTMALALACCQPNRQPAAPVLLPSVGD